VNLNQNGPSYLRLLQSGELRHRVESLEALLARCTVCPRDCLNNRLEDEIAACYSGRLPIVSSYTAHFGEEPPLSGTRGAGNIFFGNCNLRCVYCQNYQISQTHKEQIKNEVTHERLAEMMLELQARRNDITRVNVAEALETAFEGRGVGFYREPGSAGTTWRRLLQRSSGSGRILPDCPPLRERGRAFQLRGRAGGQSAAASATAANNALLKLDSRL